MSRMKPFRKLIDFETAKELVLSNTISLTGTVLVKVLEADGRVIVDDVMANIDVPGFKRAAMDGYAVVASDTFDASKMNPRQLLLSGKIFPGATPDITIKKGICCQIATGAPMPPGADAVVMVEETALDGELVKVHKPVYPGASVSRPDSDIQKDTLVLRAGEVLTPPRIGILAALGIEEIEVYSKPSVMIFPTGDEVVPPGAPLEYGQIFDINSYTLSTLLCRSGADVTIGDITGDTRENLIDCLERGARSDYILFSGGSSVGERDLIASVIEEMGEIIFHGIALKPGKPTICGRVGDSLVFGMPGYPTSCLTNAYVLLLPSLCKMGHLVMKREMVHAELSEKIVSSIGRHQIYTVRLEGARAVPVFKESGAITSMGYATGYIEIPANTEFVERGTGVVVNIF